MVITMFSVQLPVIPQFITVVGYPIFILVLIWINKTFIFLINLRVLNYLRLGSNRSVVEKIRSHHLWLLLTLQISSLT